MLIVRQTDRHANRGLGEGCGSSSLPSSSNAASRITTERALRPASFAPTLPPSPYTDARISSSSPCPLSLSSLPPSPFPSADPRATCTLLRGPAGSGEERAAAAACHWKHAEPCGGSGAAPDPPAEEPGGRRAGPGEADTRNAGCGSRSKTVEQVGPAESARGSPRGQSGARARVMTDAVRHGSGRHGLLGEGLASSGEGPVWHRHGQLPWLPR
jgi:hypothetical protein